MTKLVSHSWTTLDRLWHGIFYWFGSNCDLFERNVKARFDFFVSSESRWAPTAPTTKHQPQSQENQVKCIWKVMALTKSNAFNVIACHIHSSALNIKALPFISRSALKDTKSSYPITSQSRRHVVKATRPYKGPTIAVKYDVD